MKAESKVFTMVSENAPKCPKCRTELPIPGLSDYQYECGGCGGTYTVNMELVRVFRTEMWSNG